MLEMIDREFGCVIKCWSAIFGGVVLQSFLFIVGGLVELDHIVPALALTGTLIVAEITHGLLPQR